MDLFLTMLFKPLVFLVLFAAILIPARLFVQKKMKDGKLKRLLLTRLD